MKENYNHGRKATGENAGKTYRIVAKCDPYNARRHHHGEEVVRYDGATPVEWVHDDRRSLTLKEANDHLFGMLKVAAGQYFDNWGLAVMNVEKLGLSIDAGTLQDGTRYFHDDAMTYSVEPE